MSIGGLKLSRMIAALAVATAVVALAPTAEADWEPSKELLLVTHSSPGSGNDLVLRLLAKIWQDNKLIPVGARVENVRGGGGLKARMFVARQKKGDEHLLWSYTPTQLVRPLMRNDDVNYKSVTKIAMLAVEPQVIALHADSHFKTLKDLIEYAKANPKKVVQGGGPFGNSASIAGEQLKGKYQIDAPYTPFQGGGEAVLQLLGKHVDFVIESPSEVKEHVDAGKIRLLASTDKLSALPDVPTFEEAGYPFDDQKAFRGIMAPPEISDEVRAYYIDLLDRTRKTQAWKDYLDQQMLAEFWLPGDEMTTYLDKEAGARMVVLEKLGLTKK